MNVAGKTLRQWFSMSSLSIGQLTFMSFLLILAVVLLTSIGSILTARHIGTTFNELQRVQTVGKVAEEIDRRVNNLRIAARDFVTDPDAQPERISAAVASLGDLISETRIELAPYQRDMVDGVVARLATYRDGIVGVSELIRKRSQLASELEPLRSQFEAALGAVSDQAVSRNLMQVQSQIASATLIHDASALDNAVKRMRSTEIPDPRMQGLTHGYADAVAEIAGVERAILAIDRDVLGTEGKQISRVTALLLGS